MDYLRPPRLPPPREPPPLLRAPPLYPPLLRFPLLIELPDRLACPRLLCALAPVLPESTPLKPLVRLPDEPDPPYEPYEPVPLGRAFAPPLYPPAVPPDRVGRPVSARPR